MDRTPPEWHPSGFGDEVGSYALRAYDYLLLVDPLLPEDEPEPVLDALDAMLRSRVAILVTIGLAGSLEVSTLQRRMRRIRR